MTTSALRASARPGQDQPTPSLTAARERMQRAGADLWRVLDASGHVIGHVQSLGHPLGVRFVAKRYHPPLAGFRDLGEFWSADEAVASLRYST